MQLPSQAGHVISGMPSTMRSDSHRCICWAEKLLHITFCVGGTRYKKTFATVGSFRAVEDIAQGDFHWVGLAGDAFFEQRVTDLNRSTLDNC